MPHAAFGIVTIPKCAELIQLITTGGAALHAMRTKHSACWQKLEGHGGFKEVQTSVKLFICHTAHQEHIIQVNLGYGSADHIKHVALDLGPVVGQLPAEAAAAAHKQQQ